MDKSDKLNVKEGTIGNQGVGASGASYDGSLKASNSSPLISLIATINMSRGLYNVDVPATFRVSLTTVGDLDMLTKDIEVGKHEELLSGMTNDKHDSTIVDALMAENLNVPSEDGLSIIMSQIGKPIMLDSYTSSMCIESWKRSSFARCLIESNAKDVLKESLTISVPLIKDTRFTIKTVTIEYE
nr:zinc knuckle CX2CX4HX4C [Tanacetum cinerariifolium]GEX69608.1 zinc knuckle CX2CX4HX4C [Tanacetum cinerariifolium]